MSILRDGKVLVATSAMTEAELARHLENLTFEPQISHEFGKPPPPIKAARIEDGMLVVPRAYGLAAFGPPARNENVQDQSRDYATSMAFDGALREGPQEEAVAAAMHAMENPSRGGATICLPCGFGKTVVALWIASLCKSKVLVLCHKSCLLDQWRERIAQYLPEASVGTIQGPKHDTEGRDIVVGMLQSVSSHPYPAGTLRGYGLLVVDEAHHVPAATFTAAVEKVGSTKTLALTATPVRRDGLTSILFHTLGDICYQVERPKVDGIVKIRRLPSSPTIRERRLRGGEGPVNTARLMNDIAKDEKRTCAIVDDVMQLLHEEEEEEDVSTVLSPQKKSGERCIMILSDRTEQLKTMQAMLMQKDCTGPKAGILAADEHGGARLLIGATKAKDRPSALQARIVLTTFPFSQEGVDRPRLDTLVLATPKGDIVQAVGRILRNHPDKQVPLVLDYVDTIDSGMLHGLARKRRGIYEQHGFVIDEDSRDS